MISFEKNLKRPYINFTGNYKDLKNLRGDLLRLDPYKSGKKIEYYNIPCAFDTETTSFFRQGDEIITPEQWAVLDDKCKGEWEKVAIMYIWQFGINGWCVVGRTWAQFVTFLDWLQGVLNLNENKRLLCFVHNLSYDFQFMKMYLKWEKIFATKPYMPLYALCEQGIEFRCSYRNTNKSLETVGKELLKYPVQKAVGMLDYKLLRHSETVLTDEEIYYCLNDIKVVMAYVQEQIEIEKHVSDIPLTKTGYVRRDTKSECFTDRKNPKNSKLKRFKYRHMISGLTLDAKSYDMLRWATQGGFTHANALYAGETLEDLDGVDISSAYPAEILSNKFPMSRPKLRNIKDLEQLELYCKIYCCIFTIELTNVKCVFSFDAYISRARCRQIDNPSLNNGRVKGADMLQITITNEDYWIIKRWYKWDHMRVKDFYTMIKDYLPKPIIEATLKYYENKTKLKKVIGSEAAYMLNKAMLNSIFGMMLTNIVNPEIDLQESGIWSVTDKNLEESISQYNNNRGRFLYYPWGTFITAYVRRAIILGIEAAGQDYVYTDTDSIKMFNYENHKEYFRIYNEKKIAEVDKCLEYYGLDPERSRPKNIKGQPEQIGIFDYDGHYKRFKTLGAKRYMYEDESGIHITIAGLSKIYGLDYLKRMFKDPFEAFNNDMTVGALETGKSTHTYIDEMRYGYMTDYQGKKAYYSQLSAVHLAPCEFSVSMAADYIALIRSLQMVNYNHNLL